MEKKFKFRTKSLIFIYYQKFNFYSLCFSECGDKFFKTNLKLKM